MRTILQRLKRGALAGRPSANFDPIVATALRYNGLFEPEWYLRQNPDVAAAGVDPLRHFLASGMTEGRDPSPLFSSSYYRERNPDVVAAGQIPLVHFLRGGASENRQPHPLVAMRWLREQLGPGLPMDNPLLGLLMSRDRLGPRPAFDMDHLAAALGLDAKATTYDILVAYFALPAGQRPSPHSLIDQAFLVQQTGASPIDPVERYFREGGIYSSCHRLFDKDHVWNHLGPLRDTVGELSLLDLALIAPDPGQRKTSPLLDPAHYARQLAAPLTELPAQHYVRTGSAEGRDPTLFFDDAAYRARYLRDQRGITSLEHYLAHGREPWMSLAPRFPDRFYVTRYPEVARDYPGTPLQHYLAHGLAEGRRLHDSVWSDPFDNWDDLRRAVREGAEGFDEKAPEVSVIVPAYNQFLYTLRCVWSILRAGDKARLQVIIADDGSTDETEAFFSAIKGITYIRNPRNMGFLQSCNHAAERAKATYLYFLNNDTAVQPGWIDSLLDVARETPDAGIVGSKLVYPDGTLQEAGGFVWADGGGANLGRNSDPAEPGFNLRRDADYISGAAIMVPASVWRDVGGFDERYCPAYCEDTDLAMRLRNLGWRVIYQPASVIVHFEGVSSGTSTDSGIKAYQVINFEKLRDRWAFALERHQTSQSIQPRAIPRAPRPRILMIDHRIPEPDKDAGSVVAWWHIRLYLALGYEVTFLPVNLLLGAGYGRALQAIGAEVLHEPYVLDINSYIDEHAAGFDAFYVCRYGEGGRFIERLRQRAPEVPLIFNTADLHFLRAERQARQRGAGPELASLAADVKARELAAIARATDTMLVSTYERDHLQAMGVRDSLSVIPLVMPVQETVPPMDTRSGIAFVGGYEHTPNVDAVFHFLDAIWPLIRDARPDLDFYIVGSRPTPEILEIDQPGVHVVGYVADLEGFLARRLATVVPLRYGAGIKGKIASSLAAGVPCISTPIGAEGMGLKVDEEILIGDTPEAFAQAVLRLVATPELWNTLSDAGRAFVAREYSPEVTEKRLLRQLAKVGAAPFAGRCGITGALEARRFLHGSDPDSLSRGDGAPTSSERVLAAALARMAGAAPGTALANVREADLPAVAITGLMPALTRHMADRGREALPQGARVAVCRLPLDDGADAALEAFLAGLTSECHDVMLACPPTVRGKGAARAEAPRLSALVRKLEAAGWDVRVDRMPLKECALTGVALIEARQTIAHKHSAQNKGGL